jgi:rSAM/selenodomain-associated transferase 2
MKISVIIPAYNEESCLAHCIESVRSQNHPAEIIVTDGGSEDSTRTMARNLSVKVIDIGERNLGKQLNKAAAIAKGEIILFLHADSLLTSGIFEQIEASLNQKEYIGGAFRMKLTGKRSFYRFLEAGGDLYCQLTKTYFGDRGIFIRASVFKQMEGFREMAIMADVEFSRRMNSLGKTAFLPGPIISSSRKFDSEGSVNTLSKILWALLAYRLGYPPEKIREKYYGCKS